MKERILLVEDIDDLRQLYQTELQVKGYDVQVASNWRSALDKLGNLPPEVVILDLDCSKGLGLECLSGLMEVRPHVKVVVITSEPSIQWDFRSWIADALLIGSSDVTRLTATVDQLLHSEGGGKDPVGSGV